MSRHHWKIPPNENKYEKAVKESIDLRGGMLIFTFFKRIEFIDATLGIFFGRLDFVSGKKLENSSVIIRSKCRKSTIPAVLWIQFNSRCHFVCFRASMNISIDLFLCSAIDNRLQTEDWSSKRIVIIYFSPILCIRRDLLADAALFDEINRTFHFMQIPFAITTFDSSRNRIACGYFRSVQFLLFISSD